MKAIEIIDKMEEWAKTKLIDTWDNTGFQVGDGDKQIKRVLIALDLDEKILEIVLKEDYDMVITHHPIIFSPLKSITSKNPKEDLILKIIKSNIVVYNAHSNLDLAIGGVNDVLSNLLDIENRQPLHLINEDTKEYGYGRVGNIQKISLLDLADKVKEKLDVKSLNIYGSTDIEVDRLAVCGGSGSDFIVDAYRHGAKVYLTGDIKYHEAQLAHELGLTIIDPGHFHSEKIVLPEIKKYLDENFKGILNTKVIMESSLPYQIY